MAASHAIAQVPYPPRHAIPDALFQSCQSHETSHHVDCSIFTRDEQLWWPDEVVRVVLEFRVGRDIPCPRISPFPPRFYVWD